MDFIAVLVYVLSGYLWLERMKEKNNDPLDNFLNEKLNDTKEKNTIR